MRRTLSLLLLIIILLPQSSFSQKTFLEPFGGYQIDLNKDKTKLINSGLQVAFVFKKKKYEILLQVQRSWPQKANYIDTGFTLNPALPLSAPAQKTLSPSSFSFAVGHRVKLAGRKTKNSYFIKAFTGILYQRTAVTYQYDKTNYIVLNPDQTQHVAGIFVSGGFEYMRQLKSSRLFFELNFSSPPGGSYKYPHQYGLLAPMSFNIGYSIQLTKK